jgi:glycosyltransferase involved in cell wall biosynthesis
VKFFSWEERVPGARVLQVSNMWPIDADEPGPAGSPGPRYGIFVKRQVDSFVDAGVKCDVLLIRGFESPLAYPITALYLFGLGLTGRYQLVHVHAGETALAARFYLRAPLIVSYYGDDLLGTPDAEGVVPAHRRFRRWVQRVHASLATRSITQSREMESVLPKAAQARNEVIPSGVDQDLFQPIDRAVARERLGWDAAERVALFAADPGVPRKRHWLAAEGCARAAEHLDRVRLHVADNVEPDEVPLLMSAADCLLLTSSIEGSPNVVKEAIQSDLPVVTTRVGDVDDVLAEVEPSWICDATPAAIGDALVECLGNPRRSDGREKTSSWLSEEAILQRHLELYEELAPGACSS